MPTGAHNRQIVLKNRPVGMPTAADFAMVESRVPEPGNREVLTRALWLSLDPYMRWRMSDRKSYAPSVPLGGVMVARTVSRVIESHDPGFAPGDIVLGPGGWQDYSALPAASLRKLDPEVVPVSTALGVLGMPGMTAYVGLLDIGRPRAGEIVVVFRPDQRLPCRRRCRRGREVPVRGRRVGLRRLRRPSGAWPGRRPGPGMPRRRRSLFRERGRRGPAGRLAVAQRLRPRGGLWAHRSV